MTIIIASKQETELINKSHSAFENKDYETAFNAEHKLYGVWFNKYIASKNPQEKEGLIKGMEELRII